MSLAHAQCSLGVSSLPLSLAECALRQLVRGEPGTLGFSHRTVVFPGLDLLIHRMGASTYCLLRGERDHGARRLVCPLSHLSLISFQDSLAVMGSLIQVVYSSPENACSGGRFLAWGGDVEALRVAAISFSAGSLESRLGHSPLLAALFLKACVSSSSAGR